MINENGVQADEDWYEIYVNAGSEQLLVNLTFTHANGDIDIQVYNSGGDLVTGSASTTNNEYINYILSTNGTYYLRIYYWAGGGTGNTYDLWWDDVDATPPSVPGITSPSDGENISAKDITVAWTSASDNDAGVKGYKVKNETGSWIDVGATTSYTFPNMPEGDHTLYVKAYDWEGNEAVSASVSFTVDTIKPSFGYITPNASYFTTKTPTIEWTGSDSGTGIKTFQWRVDGGIWHNKTTANITLSGLQDGQHTITVWVYDWAGNIRDPTLVFTVDATPPSVTIEHP
ncbi:MAG: hypothetical protein GWO20_08360, partial [Candidatus Korarchaeota archaeon]|nr:hypothetical protein [Candidatus Korarchaeota archaeon]NIU82030.1 hypothetical protein [Candidatus Thorarchaeota archaeon]NIW13854.1 hypothetical protein [Candidatus Thorarchaeota archaeon]NIW51965.1 hypothetical protein [Candidatus Korarchaeota archaeon]